MPMSQLLLYYIPTCSFCLKVLQFMRQNNITIPLKNRDENPQIQRELVKLGGSTQVPCLVIDGKALYESEDIIAWLKANYKQ